MNNRIAIIDIGTNTFNLLVVDRFEKNFDIVYKERIGVGLGHKGINNSNIAPEAFKRGIDTLKRYHKKCLDLNVSSISAIGTSAVRNASNKDEFTATAYNEAKIKINVISGHDEAHYIYNGVKLGHYFEHDTLIMDIGGGSTEFIFANSEGMKSKISFEIGVSRIHQLFELPEQFDNCTVRMIEDYLEESTQGYFDNRRAKTLVGSSGSFKTFYEIYLNRQYPRNEYVHINMDELLYTLNQTTYSTKHDRDNNDYIIPIRKKMINIASVKTNWIINKLDIANFVVSPYSLKEGFIFANHESFVC